MSMRNRPRAAVVMLAVAVIGWGSWSVMGQPVVSEVEFHQLDWFQPDLTPAQENSLWGRLTFSYAPDDYTWY